MGCVRPKATNAGRPDSTPVMPGSTPKKPDQKWVFAACAVVAAVVVAAIVPVNTRSAERVPSPRPTPRATETARPMASPHRGLPALAPCTPAEFVPPFTFPEIPFPAMTIAPDTPAGVPAKIGPQAADGQLVFVVTSSDRSKTACNPINPYVQATARGIFVNVHVIVTNTGAQPLVFFPADQKFRVNGIVVNADAAAALWTLTAAVGVSPGASVPVTLSFDVPVDTPRGGTLELHESAMSPGVDVALPPPN